MVDVVALLVAKDIASPKHVVVLGDALVDVWVHGTLSTCQDGCSKFREQVRFTTPGGAANAANCLKHWMSQVSLFASPEPGTKTRFIHKGQIEFRCDEDVYAPISENLSKRALAAANAADAVLVCDYDKGFLEQQFLQQALSAARDRGVPCVVDAKQGPEMYPDVVLKCNLDYANRYEEVYLRESTVVTRGAKYPVIVQNGTHRTSTSGYVPCVNHVGAGDCFSAHLALALAHGFDLVDAVEVAHRAGRVYVQHPHNRPPWPTEVVETSK